MNKTQLIAAMAEKSGLSKKDSEKALSAFTDVVSDALVDGDKVQITGFGSFEVIKRTERMGRNLYTGEPLLVKASKSPKFKASKTLKDALRN